MGKTAKKCGFLKEMLFWIVLLGVDVLAMYLIHRGFGKYNNYKDTMPVMLPVGAFMPLLAAVLRYFPRKKGALIAGIAAALVLGVAIGMVALAGFYGEHPFIIEAFCGRNMEALLPGEVTSVTGRLYAGGESDSDELTLREDLGWYEGTGQNSLINGLPDYRGVKRVPEKAEWVQLRFALADGGERELLLSCDDKWNYIEEPGVGMWRRSRSDGEEYLVWRESCVNKEFSLAFSDPLEAGETPTLAPGHVDGEKAVWIEWTREDYNGDLYMDASWYHNNTFDHETPEGYAPERARDVRWLFVKERTSHVYEGYWYNTRTGEHVSDSYKDAYQVTVYDLASGEKEVLAKTDRTRSMSEEADALDIGNCMERYFGIDKE